MKSMLMLMGFGAGLWGLTWLAGFDGSPSFEEQIAAAERPISAERLAQSRKLLGLEIKEDHSKEKYRRMTGKIVPRERWGLE